MSDVITEITPLETGAEVDYIVERHKMQFDYPIHTHPAIELNFVENARGARRVVGDSIEELGDYDLALIGSNLEHGWEQHQCADRRIREITIQFPGDVVGDSLFARTQLQSIHRLLVRAQNGIAFELPAIMRVYNLLDEISHSEPGFYRVLKLFTILYELSIDDNWHTLASSSFAQSTLPTDSRRIRKVAQYINTHIADDIRLADLADLAGMAPSAFSRFFRQRTGKTVTDYIIDIRLGIATRSLVDTTMTISEICYDCGFNNVSNFNRIFKSRKGCSPKDFRANYKKFKVIV